MLRHRLNYEKIPDEDNVDGSDDSRLEEGGVEEDSFTAEQFKIPKRRISWITIAFILVLFAMGVTLMSIASFMLLNLIERESDRFWPVVILGFLTIVPGCYYTWILLCIWIGVPGYSEDDIPEFN